MQFVLFLVLVASCVEAAAAQSKLPVLAMLLFAVVAIIVLHMVAHMKLGLVKSFTLGTSYPEWPDALYFSLVTFTTLGDGDLAPHEEYRMVSAFQATFGYLFLGALVGMLVTMLSRR